jgi:Tfp pilus assembly protein PilO
VRPRRPFWSRWLLPVFALLLAVNLAGLALWTVPRGLHQRSARARVRAAREEAVRVREELAALRERAAAIRANGRDLARFYRECAGSPKADLVESLQAIESMARAPGLKPGARAISREQLMGAPLERVKITLPLEGSYTQLVGFLREVERSNRFLTIDGIALRAGQELRGQGATLQVELSTYLRRAPGAPSERGGNAD